MRYAKARQVLTKEGPAPLKFAALIDRKAAELEILSNQSVGLTMNYINLVANKSTYWALHAYAERLDIEKRLWKKFNECTRLASYAAGSRFRFALPRSLCRITQAVSTLLVSLEYDERNEMARQYALSAFQISKLAAWIAERNDDTEMFKLAALSAVPLARSGGEECIIWAKETIGRLRDDEIRNDGLARLGRQIRRSKGEKVEGDIWGDATAEQIYINMAMAILQYLP